MNRKGIFFTTFGLAVVSFTASLVVRFSDLSTRGVERAKAANLIVYTHSSFMDAYGPGAEIKDEFEKTCVCTVEYVDAGGAAEVIEKLRLDPTRRVDVILGLDFLMLKRAATHIRLQKLDPPEIKLAPEIATHVFERFVPYEWSPMGFIYREGEVPVVSNYDEAIKRWPKKSVALQDPTLSSPGLVWFFGFYNEFNGKDVSGLTGPLNQWRGVVHSYSPSWSAAYGLFKRGQAKLAFSYLTSLAYHWQEENDRRYQFMNFAGGHPVQINYAAVPDSCWNCNVAKRFIKHLTGESSQATLAKKNYMFPVNVNAVRTAIYSELPQVKVLLMTDVEKFVNESDSLLKNWGANR